MRTSAGATIGVIAKGVDVHATLGVGIVAGDVEGDGGWAVLGVLLEGHGALDVGVTTENCDCCMLSAGSFTHQAIHAGVMSCAPPKPFACVW